MSAEHNIKKPLFGMTLADLQGVVAELGLPRFAAGQMARWLYARRVESIDAMTDLSKVARERLSQSYIIGRTKPVGEALSSDGTKKYLFEVQCGRHIETVMIPDKDRATLCVSSQAGCRMGCKFCMTGRGGMFGSLTATEIVNQFASVAESEALTNIVYMGMGEPMDNIDEVLRSLEIMTSEWGYGWSPTRITVSTVGVIEPLKRFLDESKAHLAISLHNAIPSERILMMPVENRHPITKVIELLRRYDFSHQRRVSFEYIVFKGLNDSAAHIKALKRLLSGLACRINLIRFHTIPDTEFVGADEASMIRFRDELSRSGIITTIRASRGEDIQAACGLLADRAALQK